MLRSPGMLRWMMVGRETRNSSSSLLVSSSVDSGPERGRGLVGRPVLLWDVSLSDYHYDLATTRDGFDPPAPLGTVPRALILLPAQDYLPAPEPIDPARSTRRLHPECVIVLFCFFRQH